MNHLSRMLTAGGAEVQPLSLDMADAIQGQWVVPNLTRVGSTVYSGSAGETGQFFIHRVDGEVVNRTVLDDYESDDHNVPAVLELLDGRMMTAYATHSLRKWVRVRVSATANSDDWGAFTELATSENATYMQLARATGQARVWMLHRVGSSSLGNWAMRYTDDNGATWSSERNLCPNTYITSVVAEDGFSLRCYGYEHPVVGTDHDIRTFKIDLITGDVMNSAGTVYGNAIEGTGLPITLAEQHKAVDMVGATTVRMYEVGKFATAGILGSEFVDATGGTYYRYSSAATSGLFTRQAIATTGPAFYEASSNYFGGACFGTSLDEVYCARNLGNGVGLGRWELVRYVTTNGGASWQRAGVIRRAPNIIICRPQVGAGRLWWSEVSSYVSYTNFQSTLRSIPL